MYAIGLALGIQAYFKAAATIIAVIPFWIEISAMRQRLFTNKHDLHDVAAINNVGRATLLHATWLSKIDAFGVGLIFASQKLLMIV